MTTEQQLPDLPLISLQTAEEATTLQLVKGKRTLIDFWTTRCTRCPAALDKLEAAALEHPCLNGRLAEVNDDDNSSPHVQVVAICCDKLDGAREILEGSEKLRWQNLHHYFMERQDKERAKKVLGFTSVPFYVVVNEDGDIVYKGNKAVEFDNLQLLFENSNDTQAKTISKENEGEDLVGPSCANKKTEASEDRTFVLEELDF